MSTTLQDFDAVMGHCRRVFEAKARDYGSSWRVLRPVAVTDQLFIKAKRIRTLQQTGENRVGEDPVNDYVGLVNYSLIALMVLQNAHLDPFAVPDPPIDDQLKLYDALVGETRALLERKNHDYGEAWREMRLESLVDLMLAKLMRIKQLEDLPEGPQASEGVAANYQDVLNYAVFSLIKQGMGLPVSEKK